jgi:hypothetical protein
MSQTSPGVSRASNRSQGSSGQPISIQYNYNVNVNAETDSDPNDIARTVLHKIQRMDDRRVRGVKI